jgi:hypothetical protein
MSAAAKRKRLKINPVEHAPAPLRDNASTEEILKHADAAMRHAQDVFAWNQQVLQIDSRIEDLAARFHGESNRNLRTIASNYLVMAEIVLNAFMTATARSDELRPEIHSLRVQVQELVGRINKNVHDRIRAGKRKRGTKGVLRRVVERLKPASLEEFLELLSGDDESVLDKLQAREDPIHFEFIERQDDRGILLYKADLKEKRVSYKRIANLVQEVRRPLKKR